MLATTTKYLIKIEFFTDLKKKKKTKKVQFADV